MSKIINDQPWIVSLALLPTSSEAQFTASDPIRSVTRWVLSCGVFGLFFVLSTLVEILVRAVARRTASRRTRTRIHLAKTFYACLLQNIGASQQVSRVRRARWRPRVMLVEPGWKDATRGLENSNTVSPTITTTEGVV